MGRFLVGFVVGAAIGVTIAVVLTPRSGEQNRESIARQINEAMEVGRKVAAIREQELWQQFRDQLRAGEAE